jgi:hypothetical protein
MATAGVAAAGATAAGMAGGTDTAGWQIVTWTAGGVALVAFLVASGRLLRITWLDRRPRRGVPAAAWLVLTTTAAGILLDELVGPPAGVQAGWTVLTVPAALWIALRGPAVAAQPAGAGLVLDPSTDAPMTEGPTEGPVPTSRPSAGPPSAGSTTTASAVPGAAGVLDPATNRPAEPGSGSAGQTVAEPPPRELAPDEWPPVGPRAARRQDTGRGRLARRVRYGSARAAARLRDQDDLVQTLVVASYALQLGDHGTARDAVDDALRTSRRTLDALRTEAGPAALVRHGPHDRRDGRDGPGGTGERRGFRFGFRST